MSTLTMPASLYLKPDRATSWLEDPAPPRPWSRWLRHIVGGRWFRWPCGCCGCAPITIIVTCSGGPAVGVTVDIISGGTTITSGTTNGSGLVTLTIPSAGTYTVQVSGGSCSFEISSDVALSCGGGTTVECCGCEVCNIPTTVYLTDSFGTVTLTGPVGGPWTGCHNLSATGATGTVSGGTCTATEGSGTTCIFYTMSCGDSPNPATITIQRTWCGIGIPQPGTVTGYVLSLGTCPGDCGACVTPGACTQSSNTATGTGQPSDCTPFALSMTLTDYPFNSVSDPLSSSVTVSA